jgi:hypothetical protein
MRGHGNLDHLGPGRPHRPNARPQIGRNAGEVVRRQDHSPPGPPGDQAAEGRVPFDIDILGIEPGCPLQHAEPLLFGAVEPSALTARPTSHNDGRSTTVERTLHIDVADAVEAQLDKVGDGRRAVAPRPEAGHRRRRYRHAQERYGHKCKKPLQPPG